jgi:tRNA/rRNA methyltransferase
MANFGLENLRLVAPLFNPLDSRAIAMAAGAEAILRKALVFDSLENAIADLVYVYGTSASERHIIKHNQSARAAMEKIVLQSHTGIVFGPERTGLTNTEMTFFRSVIHIPVKVEFNSLNLAQAVAITAYEWFQTQTSYTGKLHLGDTSPAKIDDIRNLLTVLEHALNEMNYWRIDRKKPIMWRNLQNIFTRMDLTEQEVRTLQGVIRTLKKED